MSSVISVSITRKGFPALWEGGGGYTSTGKSQLIANEDGSSAAPVYVRQRGELACADDHALFAVTTGMLVVQAQQHRGDFTITVSRIAALDDKQATLETIYAFEKGEWDVDLPQNLVHVVEAAKKKALTYHCRKPIWFRETSTT